MTDLEHSTKAVLETAEIDSNNLGSSRLLKLISINIHSTRQILDIINKNKLHTIYTHLFTVLLKSMGPLSLFSPPPPPPPKKKYFYSARLY